MTRSRYDLQFLHPLRTPAWLILPDRTWHGQQEMGFPTHYFAFGSSAWGPSLHCGRRPRPGTMARDYESLRDDNVWGFNRN